jgi:hypothetical protein
MGDTRSPARRSPGWSPTETLEEARAMATEAIEAYLESLQADDEPIPESDVVEPGPLIEPVRVRLGHG